MVAMEAFCDVSIKLERDFRETYVRPDAFIAILLLKVQKNSIGLSAYFQNYFRGAHWPNG